MVAERDKGARFMRARYMIADRGKRTRFMIAEHDKRARFMVAERGRRARLHGSRAWWSWKGFSRMACQSHFSSNFKGRRSAINNKAHSSQNFNASLVEPIL